MKLRTGFKGIILVITVVFLAAFAAGCSVAEKAKTLKDDIVNITMDQVAMQLENSLNQEFPGVQVNTPDVINSSGQVNWDSFKQTELANYVFYSFGDYEFRAVLRGDGVFKIERENFATNEIFSYAEFRVERVDGKFKVTAK